MKSLALNTSFVLFLGGCTFTEHELNLSPEMPVALDPIKRETGIALSFTDQRDGHIIGKRGGLAKITAKNLLRRIETGMRNMFTRKGYRLVAKNGPSDVDVQIRIRSFKYDVPDELFTTGEHNTAVFIVVAEKQGETMKRTYRSDNEKRMHAVSFADEINRQMSDILNDMLVQIAQDAELERFLTER